MVTDIAATTLLTVTVVVAMLIVASEECIESSLFEEKQVNPIKTCLTYSEYRLSKRKIIIVVAIVDNKRNSISNNKWMLNIYIKHSIKLHFSLHFGIGEFIFDPCTDTTYISLLRKLLKSFKCGKSPKWFKTLVH